MGGGTSQAEHPCCAPATPPHQHTAPPVTTKSQKGRAKVLCIHGYGQSSAWLEEHTEVLQSALSAAVEFLFVDSPTLQRDKGWWRRRDSQVGPTGGGATRYEGLEEALRYLRQFMHLHGPFKGVIGLSQGACMTGLLCGLLAADQQMCPPAGLPPVAFDFAVLCSGHICHDKRVHRMYWTPEAVLPACDACGVQVQQAKQALRSGPPFPLEMVMMTNCLVACWGRTCSVVLTLTPFRFRRALGVNSHDTAVVNANTRTGEATRVNAGGR